MLRKLYLSFAFSLFAISLFSGLDRLCHRPSNRFFIDHRRTSNLFSPRWGTPTLSHREQKELHHILNQKFILYDRGAHACVCMSEDGQYILKFFKHQQLKPKSWLAYIPCSLNPHYQELLFRKKKTEEILYAWTTAFTELKKETGLIYLHANNAQKLRQRVTILDNNMQEHEVDLDKTVFCVQHHAQLPYLRIADLMHREDVEGAKRIISSIFSLIDRLGEKCVIDEEGSFECNFGLIEDQAMQIDIGNLHIDPARNVTPIYKKNVEPMTRNLKKWIEATYPELAPHVQNCLKLDFATF